MNSTLPPLDRSSVGLSWRTSAAVLAGAVFLAPYVTWRPADVLFTFSDALFVVGAGLLIASLKLPFAPLAHWTPFMSVAVAVLLSGLLVGSFVNGDPERWLVAAAQYAFTFVLLPMLLVAQGEKRTLLLMKSAIAGMVLMELFGIGVYLLAEPGYQSYSRFGHNFISGGGRLTAFLGNANWNGCMIAMTLPLLLFLRVRGQIGLAVFSTALAILLAGLVLAASVTGITSALIAFFIFSLIGRARLSAKLIGLLALSWIGFVAFGLSTPKAFSERVATAVETGDVHSAGTFTGRAELMAEAWDIVEDTSWVGIGVDQYRKVSEHQAPVHNMYLLVWAEGGLPALLGWVVLVGLFGAMALAAIRVDPLATALGLSVLAVFVVFSNTSPHMYARLWAVPLLLAMSVPLAAVARVGRPIKLREPWAKTRMPA